MKDRKISIAVFQRFLEAASKCDDATFDALMSGRAKIFIEIPFGAKPKGKSQRQPSFSFAAEDVVDLLEKLSKFSSRDEGVRFLLDFGMTKIELSKIAKILELPVRNEDTVKSLQDKIVENTIGGRLNSDAIRNSRSIE